MWRLRKNNLLVNEKDKLFVHKVHLERLLHAKSHIENKGPDTPFFMKNKLSKKEINRVKEKKRCYENSIIFSRLLDINNTFSPYSKINKPFYCPAFDKKRHNFHKIEKQNDIYKYNKFLFNRLINEKSFYPTQRLLVKNDYENYIKDNIKRKRLDNPNLNFVTFNKFKTNIVKYYNLKRCNSARVLNKSKVRDYNEIGIDITNRRNKSNYNNFIPHNQSYNNLLGKRNKKNNSNNISFNSTMLTSRMGKNLSRCQSAFNIRNNNLN